MTKAKAANNIKIVNFGGGYAVGVYADFIGAYIIFDIDGDEVTISVLNEFFVNAESTVYPVPNDIEFYVTQEEYDRIYNLISLDKILASYLLKFLRKCNPRSLNNQTFFDIKGLMIMDMFRRYGVEVEAEID